MAAQTLANRLVNTAIPHFTTGHSRYVQEVKRYFRDGCRWLDAGGGRRIFPDLYDGEQELVARAARVAVCDADPESIEEHVSVSERILGTLSAIPVPDRSFDFITCGMVVEHLSEPLPCFRELARVLDHGGRLLIHTPNLWSYSTLAAILSKAIPFRQQLIAQLTGRLEKDIFPTFYRCNTQRAMRSTLKKAGLRVESLQFWRAGVLFRSIPPIAALEGLYHRLTRFEAFAPLRDQLFVVATKP